LAVGALLDAPETTGFEPELEEVDLRLAHHPPQPQQQPVVVVGGIINAVGVGDEGSP